MVIVLAIGTPTLTRAAPRVAITDSFRYSTAPGWLLNGACLTAGNACPTAPKNEGEGNGWLRLTNNQTWQAGSAIYNTAFSSSDGVQIAFTYATYGGSFDADGFTFYLIDGATGIPTVGAPGGALGYSWRDKWDDVPPGRKDGVTNGYVGIGFDEYGNFSQGTLPTERYGDCTTPCPGRIPNSITIRGSGSLQTGFNYLTRANYSLNTVDRAHARNVRITITPGATKSITVEIDSGSGYQTIINAFNLTTATGQAALPATLKMGFSGSTGSFTNYHEIRNLTVGGAQPTTTTVVCTPNPSMVGQSVTCTITVASSVGTPAGTVDLYDGSTFLGNLTLNGSGQTTYRTSAFTQGAHAIQANYLGSGIHSVSSGNTVQNVNAAQIASTTPREVPEGDTLLLLGGGMSGLGVWLRWQWGKRRARKNV